LEAQGHISSVTIIFKLYKMKKHVCPKYQSLALFNLAKLTCIIWNYHHVHLSMPSTRVTYMSIKLMFSLAERYHKPGFKTNTYYVHITVKNRQYGSNGNEPPSCYNLDWVGRVFLYNNLRAHGQTFLDSLLRTPVAI